MARLVAAIGVAAVAFSQPVSIQYGTVPRTVIEQRLRAVEDTNLKREQMLRELFEKDGCGGRLQEQDVKHSQAPNLICTLPGQSDSTIIVGGHFDFVNAGRGVIDNWSGSSLLPSFFLSLKTVPRRHTFRFIAFTDEEKGLVGSRFYTRSMTKAEIANTSAMVNLDSVGTNPTKLELDRGDRRLANALASVAQTFKLPLSVVNVHSVGFSDSDSFQDRKIPTINIHSITNETFPLLHTQRDMMDAIKFNDYYDTYRLVTAYLAYLDQILDSSNAPSEK